jgi:hypothetical protein
MRKEVWFGLSIMAAVVIAVFWFLPPASQITNGHLGLLMLALIVIAIMLGFPTAFTLMGMGVIFAWLAYRSASHETAMQQTLDLMVQRAYSVMSNDVLISIPLFVFMGYLVERSNLIEKLFRSLHLALARIPGSLRRRHARDVRRVRDRHRHRRRGRHPDGPAGIARDASRGLQHQGVVGRHHRGRMPGHSHPPSVMLIVYGATAGVSVVKLYAGAFFPGLMLAGLYITYVVVLAKIKPALMPPLPETERRVTIPAFVAQIKIRGHGKSRSGTRGSAQGSTQRRHPHEAPRARARGHAVARHRVCSPHGIDLALAHQAGRGHRHVGIAVLHRASGRKPKRCILRPAGASRRSRAGCRSRRRKSPKPAPPVCVRPETKAPAAAGGRRLPLPNGSASRRPTAFWITLTVGRAGIVAVLFRPSRSATRGVQDAARVVLSRWRC